MMKNRKIRNLSPEIYVSFVEAAPDHGLPETAVFHRMGRTPAHAASTVVARGKEAREVFEQITLEEAIEALVRARDPFRLERPEVVYGWSAVY